MAPPRRPAAGRRSPRRDRAAGASRPGGHTPRRPAQRQRTTSPRRARQDSRRAPGGLTGRAAVLGLVVCALVVSLAYPIKQYIAERGTVTRLEGQRQQVKDRVEALEKQRALLDDPNYIRGQARERLQYVMPGDTAYVVVAPTPRHPTESPAPRDPIDLDSSKPWYGQLWQTVRSADGG